MDIVSLLIILSLLVLVIWFIGQPIFDRRARLTASRNGASALTAAEDQELSALLAERERLLSSIQELDFDYKLGKIPQEDYPAQRLFLLQQGADILRQLDSFQPDASQVTSEDRLEAAIAERRASLSSTPAPEPVAVNGKEVADDDLEVQIAARRRLRPEKAAGFCPQCGGPVQKSDRFCPKCGTSL